MKGIDISLWQNGIDLKSLPDDIKFVIIKASESDFADPLFETHYANAASAGLAIGAYHFCRAQTQLEAVKEAKVFMGVINGKRFSMPLFVDFEDSSYRKQSKESNDLIIKAFCNELEANGYWAGFYCNLDFYRNVINGEVLAKRYSHWLALWDNDDSRMFDCQVKQYGVDKLQGMNVDFDFCYVDYLPDIKRKGLNGYKSESYISYTVKAGDSLWAIAERFYKNGALFYQIANDNGIKEPYTIYPNQVLKIKEM